MERIDETAVTWGGGINAAIEGLAGDLDALSDMEVAVRVASLISALSEDSYHATWLMGVEFAAWAEAGNDPPLRLCVATAAAALAKVRARLKGGWVAWVEDDVNDVALLSAQEWVASMEAP